MKSKRAACFIRIIGILCLYVSIARPIAGNAAVHEKTRILIILDCSGSMYSKYGKADRMTAAKNILIHLVDSMKRVPNVELALRCYGHQHTAKEHDCQDTKLEIPFSPGNAAEIINFVKKVKPNGWTPIAYSLNEAARDFPDTRMRNVIMLVTDGLEECDGDPCAASKALLDKKISFQPYVVGIGLSEKMMKAFDCVGKNYTPKNEKDFGRVVSGVISNALDNTTIQVNLLDEKKQPTITNFAMAFTSIPAGKNSMYVMHTMDYSGKPDTFSIDPNYNYNLSVYTVPPLQKKNISLQMAHHNIIDLDAAQGFLNVSSTSSDYSNIPCLLRKGGSTDIINVQLMNNQQRYLVGNYDLEILVMPRIKVKDVKISPNETNKISVPNPGKLELSYKGEDVIGSVYVLRNQVQEWLFDYRGSLSMHKELYFLQPGRYITVFRQAKSSKMEDTKTQNFIITSGGFVQISPE